MRFIFKTDYGQDIKLAKHGGHVFWYSVLCALLVLAPWLISEYLLAQLTFILIYGIVGVGLMLLAGFTGQFSIGHAAFFGVGAYTQAVLTGMGWPFPLALAAGAALSAAVGIMVGLPALRVEGHLPGHCHAVVRLHRGRGLCPLGKRDGRQRRQDRGPDQDVRLDGRHRRVVLLRLPGDHGHCHAGHGEPAALAHRARLCGDPRL
jgi:hypothetical protein